MNDRMLESLLLDRTLGELSPEVSELLDAYLQLVPHVGAQAKTFDATVQLARRAVSPPAPAPVPPIPLHKPMGHWRREALALAATLCLGALVGWTLAHRSSPSDVVAVAAGPTLADGGFSSGERASVARTTFWSMSHFVGSHPSGVTPRNNPYPVLWGALGKLPQLEEKP